ncbi:alpha-glucosidase C-terminal domain-containing protein, partial [Streptomyces aureus]|uniref:alpha-glucosidase C-terminal domain-containing protein n=1 Tax=Streptomyces aureus TaxID=193461 RepID=UPI00056A195D
ASMSSPSSLLHWTRRMIEIRKQNKAFGLGTYTELHSTNPAVLAFLREAPSDEGEGDDDLVLCVHNFSRFAQPTELDLREFNGRHPVELIGGVRFPAIGRRPGPCRVPDPGPGPRIRPPAAGGRFPRA